MCESLFLPSLLVRSAVDELRTGTIVREHIEKVEAVNLTAVTQMGLDINRRHLEGSARDLKNAGLLIQRLLRIDAFIGRLSNVFLEHLAPRARVVVSDLGRNDRDTRQEEKA